MKTKLIFTSHLVSKDEVEDKLYLVGEIIHEGEFNHVFIPFNELKKTVKKWKSADVLASHDDRQYHSYVGDVIDAWVDEEKKAVLATLEIFDKDMIKRIKNRMEKGKPISVSIGAFAELMRDGKKIVASDIEPDHIALVRHPADPNAQIHIAFEREEIHNYYIYETDDYIRVRIREPDICRDGTFKTITLSAMEGIMAVVAKLKEPWRSEYLKKHPGHRSEDPMVLQSVLFAKEKGWDIIKVREWLQKHPEIDVLGMEEEEGDMMIEEEKVNEVQVNEQNDEQNVQMNEQEVDMEKIEFGYVPRHPWDYGKDAESSWKKPRLEDFTDKSWDELTVKEKRSIAGHFAWSANNPPEKFGDLKLPHHDPKTHNVVWRGVVAAMAALAGARGGVDIPKEDRKKVYNHLANHYREFDKEPPSLEFIDAFYEIVALEYEEKMREIIQNYDKELEELRKQLKEIQERELDNIRKKLMNAGFPEKVLNKLDEEDLLLLAEKVEKEEIKLNVEPKEVRKEEDPNKKVWIMNVKV